jgi:hypothetical protein
MTIKWNTYVAQLISNINAGQRNGQAAFNALQSINPDAANVIHGTELDPFYSDAKLADFSEYVMALDWDTVDLGYVVWKNRYE